MVNYAMVVGSMGSSFANTPKSKQIFASKYKTYLPTEKELKEEIAREREAVEMEKRLTEKRSGKK
jgi:hypothetical protein